MCISWRSSDGGIKYYRDGELKSTKHISEELLIKRGGTLVLFQVNRQLFAFKNSFRFYNNTESITVLNFA